MSQIYFRFYNPPINECKKDSSPFWACFLPDIAYLPRPQPSESLQPNSKGYIRSIPDSKVHQNLEHFCWNITKNIFFLWDASNLEIRYLFLHPLSFSCINIFFLIQLIPSEYHVRTIFIDQLTKEKCNSTDALFNTLASFMCPIRLSLQCIIHKEADQHVLGHFKHMVYSVNAVMVNQYIIKHTADVIELFFCI